MIVIVLCVVVVSDTGIDRLVNDGLLSGCTCCKSNEF
jgi:hypothetical protein